MEVLATGCHIAFILYELLKVLPMAFYPNPYPIFTESAQGRSSYFNTPTQNGLSKYTSNA